MPFVNQEHRKNPDLSIPGDLCYIEYKQLIDAWKKERRWTTAHNELKRLFRLDDDVDAAKFLAYMVFFCKHVMKYEDEKEKENGEI